MTAATQVAAASAAWPDYFQSIQERATKRWDQLDADPELAGPWHQLFKQVQSPRHILSELLQNADDAGASEARVSIENDRFVFEHNGEDFIEAHFASICRFGYSNKRALHTIGFRGIGFKSTFSLGDRVELFTPTLAVAFERARFTQPHWIDGADSVMITRQEVITSLHEPEKFILAIVSVTGGFAHAPRYVRGPLVEREPSFLETAIQFDLPRLLERAEEPR